MFYGKCIAEDDIPYFSLLGNLLAKVDTKTYDYKELSNEILINTGDMYFRNNVYGNDKDENKYYPFLEEAKDIPVPYARILGFSKTASPLLKKIRQNATLDIIQRPAEGKKLYSNSSAQAQIYSIDIRTADLYEQIAARKAGRKPISEYKRQQVIQ